MNNNNDIKIQNYWNDYGPNPAVINIEILARQNRAFRRVIWTGNHMQITLMSIPVNESIGLEIHKNLDQFLRIEEGKGLIKFGLDKNKLSYSQTVFKNSAIVVPAGTWHNLINSSNQPLKLYSIYSPPQHKRGTIHLTKSSAYMDENK